MFPQEQVSSGSSYIAILNQLLNILKHTSLAFQETDKTRFDLHGIHWGWESEQVGRICRINADLAPVKGETQGEQLWQEKSLLQHSSRKVSARSWETPQAKLSQ